MAQDPAEKHHNKNMITKAVNAAFEIAATAAHVFETQKNLATQWTEALNPLNTFLRQDPKIPLTEDEAALQIQQEFSEKYGAEGIKIVTDFAKCRALNGGEKHRDEPGYYAGSNYSIPAMFYLMDRALSNHNTSKYLENTYDQFVDDVERMFDEDWTSNTPLPTQKRLQNITRDYLKKIRELPVLNQEAANKSESNQYQQIAAEL